MTYKMKFGFESFKATLEYLDRFQRFYKDKERTRQYPNTVLYLFYCTDRGWNISVGKDIDEPTGIVIACIDVFYEEGYMIATRTLYRICRERIIEELHEPKVRNWSFESCQHQLGLARRAIVEIARVQCWKMGEDFEY